MARTRATKSNSKSLSKETSDSDSLAQTKSIPSPDPNPPKIFVLPKDTSADAKFVTLRNPATSNFTRYLFCPEKGFYEFTKITAPRSFPRSWLLSTTAQEAGSSSALPQNEEETTAPVVSSSYVSQAPDLLLATPFDPLFLAIPLVVPPANPSSKKRTNFLTLDDHIDEVSPEPCLHLKHILRAHEAELQALFVPRLRAACETVDAAGETMFRFSVDKLAKEMLGKAKKIVERGLPASMEERFVRRELAEPVVTAVAQEATTTVAGAESDGMEKNILAKDAEKSNSETLPSNPNFSDTASFSMESQASEATPKQSASEDPNSALATAATSFSSDVATPTNQDSEISSLLRLRTALSFLLHSYLSPDLAAQVLSNLTSKDLVSFSALDAHLEGLSKRRAQAHALQAISNNVSRKRGLAGGLEDDEAAELREEKKRKKEEEEKAKKGESRAAKELKKVNTRGMKKMSAFFTKVEKKK